MNNPAQDFYQLYIGGEWVDAFDVATLDSLFPATVEKLSTIADATLEDVYRSVEVSWKAFSRQRKS